MTLKRCGQYWFHCWHYKHRNQNIFDKKGCTYKPVYVRVTVNVCCRCKLEK